MNFVMGSNPVASKPLVFSVIMPCYNSEAYVKNALESIIDQSWPHWELITVNDGSIDKTLGILREYAEKDSRIKVYSKENGGYVSAVNLGLEHISGDYFLMMGSDDALRTDLFATLADAIGDQQPDCIAFQTEIIQDGVNLGVESITQFREGAAKFQTTLAEFSEEYPGQSEIFFARDTSKCYHQRILGDLRYYGRYGLDADGIFSMLLCHKAESFQVIPVVGYYWTVRGDSLSGRKRTFVQICDCVSNWIQFFREVNRCNYRLAETEKRYLYYLIRLLRSVAAESDSEHRTLVKDAATVIRETEEQIDYTLDLSRKDQLLLKSPSLWKLLNRVFSWRNN